MHTKNPATLDRIALKLRRSRGPDRRLDCELVALLDPDKFLAAQARGMLEITMEGVLSSGPDEAPIQKLTESLDEAAMFTLRVCPEIHDWGLHYVRNAKDLDGPYIASTAGGAGHCYRSGWTGPLAILLSLLAWVEFREGLE